MKIVEEIDFMNSLMNFLNKKKVKKIPPEDYISFSPDFLKPYIELNGVDIEYLINCVKTNPNCDLSAFLSIGALRKKLRIRPDNLNVYFESKGGGYTVSFEEYDLYVSGWDKPTYEEREDNTLLISIKSSLSDSSLIRFSLLINLGDIPKETFFSIK